MYNKDYSKEIGLDSGERIVPLRYLIPLLTLLAALGVLTVVALGHRTHSRLTAPEDRAGVTSHT